jgi:hypothetical protein
MGERDLLGFDLLCECGQLGDLDAEGGGDSPDGSPGWIAPSLDVAEPRRMQIGTVGYLFLRETASESCLPDRLPESDLGIGSWGHVRHLRGQSRPQSIESNSSRLSDEPISNQ